jgi:hypothetical protein
VVVGPDEPFDAEPEHRAHRQTLREVPVWDASAESGRLGHSGPEARAIRDVVPEWLCRASP